MKEAAELIKIDKPELFKYATNPDECIYCDWSEEPDSVIEYCNKFLPNEFKIAFEETEEEESFWLSNPFGRSKVSFEEGEDADEIIFLCITVINALISPSFQIRRFLVTDGTDCLSFYLQTSNYWTSFEEEFPEELQELFEIVESDLDLEE